MNAFVTFSTRDSTKVTLAVDAIESITEVRGWSDTARIVMKSGQVHLSETPYKSIIAAIG